MPYKSKQDRDANQKRWYQENTQSIIARHKRNRDEKRRWFIEYKSKLKCSLCSENHPACLDFHHRDASQKVMDVSRSIINSWSLKRIHEEILKCDVLCANCHRKHHDASWSNGYDTAL